MGLFAVSQFVTCVRPLQVEKAGSIHCAEPGEKAVVSVSWEGQLCGAPEIVGQHADAACQPPMLVADH
jgi:hypothetical protein